MKRGEKGEGGRSMGRTEVLRGKGRVEGVKAGEKVGGNRKTGCREATGEETGKSGGRDGEMLDQKNKDGGQRQIMRNHCKYI